VGNLTKRKRDEQISCIGKKKLSRQEAQEAARQVMAREGGRGNNRMKAYRCQFCRTEEGNPVWHTGHDIRPSHPQIKKSAPRRYEYS